MHKLTRPLRASDMYAGGYGKSGGPHCTLAWLNVVDGVGLCDNSERLSRRLGLPKHNPNGDLHPLAVWSDALVRQGRAQEVADVLNEFFVEIGVFDLALLDPEPDPPTTVVPPRTTPRVHRHVVRTAARERIGAAR